MSTEATTDRPDLSETYLTPVKAIRLKCLDCCAGSSAEVRQCELTSCALHRFRLGKNPNKKKAS